jgi:hypothetical protein
MDKCMGRYYYRFMYGQVDRRQIDKQVERLWTNNQTDRHEEYTRIRQSFVTWGIVFVDSAWTAEWEIFKHALCAVLFAAVANARSSKIRASWHSMRITEICERSFYTIGLQMYSKAKRVLQ